MAGPIPCGQSHLLERILTETTLIIRPNSPVFSVTLLRPYNADVITKRVQHDPPPPVVRNSVEEYEVELILNSRILRGKLEYLIHWKGYSIEEDKWRPSEHVKGVRRLMSEFHSQNHEAPQHISAIDFSKLPFCTIINFMDTSDTVPADWATGRCTSGHCAFEGGGECQGSLHIRSYLLS